MTAGMAVQDGIMPSYTMRMRGGLQHCEDDEMLLWPHCNSTGILCTPICEDVSVQ